jgi:hypothetical protein
MAESEEHVKTEEQQTAFFVPGGANAAERVIRECKKQNGGRLIGNPTILAGMTGINIDGAIVTVVIIEDRADPSNWWGEWARVHGWRSQAGDKT